MTMGAGRVIYQDLPKISLSLSSGQLEQDEHLTGFITQVKGQTSICHLMGILSDGGVHGHCDHLIALAKIQAQKGITVYLHVFLDGRDTPPKSAIIYIKQLMDALQDEPLITLQTISGRYYAMDRDQRWDRVQKAFEALVFGKAEQTFDDPLAFIEKCYEQGQTDEFVVPAAREGYVGIAPNDGLFMVNYRADRVIELLSSLADPTFKGFDRAGFFHKGPRIAIASYATHLDHLYPSLFPPRQVEDTLGALLSQKSIKQLRLAETEKYAHVTYFFNAGIQEPFVGEDRILVPSPRVESYDLAPEMSAREITQHLCKAIQSGQYGLIVVNYANADMVGHTGNLAASIAAIECLDLCLGEVEACACSAGATLLITADHGNAECMEDMQTGAPHTAHTLNRVPVLLIGGPEGASLKDGSLEDVAPTILSLLGVTSSIQMTGKSLIIEE